MPCDSPLLPLDQKQQQDRMNWPSSASNQNINSFAGGFNSANSNSGGANSSSNPFNNNLGGPSGHSGGGSGGSLFGGSQNQQNASVGAAGSAGGAGFGAVSSSSSPFRSNSSGQQQPGYGNSGSNGGGQQQPQQYGNVGSFNGGFGGGAASPFQQQQFNNNGQQQQQQTTMQYGNQSAMSMMNGSLGGYNAQQHQQHQQQQQPQGQQNNVGRYLPGYLTGSSLSGSPRFSNSMSNSTGNNYYEGRSSPETYHRDIASPSSSSQALPSSSSSSSRLFGGYSSTSSSGTANAGSGGASGNRDSPSRSPKTSLFSNSAYGSSRSLMLGSQRGGARQATGEYQGSSSGGNAMDEDAPPTDTLDEFDDGPGPAVGAGIVGSTPTMSSALTAPASRSGGNISSPSGQTQQLPNGNASSSSSSQQQQQVYKITIFGFPPHLSSSVLSHFQSIGMIVYNSLDASSSNNYQQKGAEPDQPQGANWLTVGYDSEWSALRALRRNGEILGGTCMIGVKWADGTPSSTSSSVAAFPSSEHQQSSDQSQQQQVAPTSRSSQQQTSTFGTPARVLPASAAWKPNAAGKAPNSPSKASTVSRISELGSGRMDPKIFADADSNGKAGADGNTKQGGGGVVGTLTNLIFGF